MKDRNRAWEAIGIIILLQPAGDIKLPLEIPSFYYCSPDRIIVIGKSM